MNGISSLIKNETTEYSLALSPSFEDPAEEDGCL